MSAHNPTFKKGVTRLIATAQYYYLTKENFTLDSTISFTLKDPLIEQSESLDFLGIRVSNMKRNVSISDDGENPFGSLRTYSTHTYDTEITFPLALFRDETKIKESKKGFVLER